MNPFGQRSAASAKGPSLRDQAPKPGVGFTYLSKAAPGRLDFFDYPCEALIHKVAKAFDAGEDEFFLLAEKKPTRIQEWRSSAHRRLASRRGRHCEAWSGNFKMS